MAGTVSEDDPDEDDEEESEALFLGTAYDCYLQGVDQFNGKYAVVSRRDGKSGKIELTPRQGKLVRAMAKEMARHPYYNPVGEKQHNVRVKISENVTISGTLDEFQRHNAAVIDDKTAAGLRRFNDHRAKYKRQVSFYAWLVWLAYSVACDAMVRMVTKEKIPKAHFFFVSKDEMAADWEWFRRLLAELEESIKKDEWAPSPREKCLECPAYAVCGHSIQKELYIL